MSRMDEFAAHTPVQSGSLVVKRGHLRAPAADGFHRRSVLLHHASERGVHAGSHIERFNGKPGRIDADHFMSSRSSRAHSPAAEAGHWMLTVLEPRRTSMRIAASVALAEIPTGTKPPELSTGALGTEGRLGTSSVPLSARSTQRRSRFAFSPRARAISQSAQKGGFAGRLLKSRQAITSTQGGQSWTPIPRIRGSLLHAD
jgi:hypothetical protein